MYDYLKKLILQFKTNIMSRFIPFIGLVISTFKAENRIVNPWFQLYHIYITIFIVIILLMIILK